MKPSTAAIVIALVTFIVYILTFLPATKPIINSMFLLYVFVTIVGILYWPFASKGVKSEGIKVMYFLMVFISTLLWVGVTGWFVSRFFYFVYLLAMMLAFLYSPFVTLVFVLILIGLFIPYIGSIDVLIDIITLVALFSVYPLSIFLQKEYLQLKQAQKKVLILKESNKEAKNKVDEVLMNKVIKFSVDMRQTVNDMRQLALVELHGDKKTGKLRSGVKMAFHKIAIIGQDSLDHIERFEEAVTGKILVHTSTKNSKKK